MKDNFTSEDLVQYLDGDLENDQVAGILAKLQSDADFATEFNRLKLSRQAIRYQGLSDRVGSIHREMMAELKDAAEPQQTAPVVRLFRPLMRIAAILLLLIGITAVYQYAQMSADNIFGGNYSPYIPGETRGVKQDKLQEYLKSGDAAGLIESFKQIQQPTAGDYFYAGNAYLQLGDARQAISQFQQVVRMNNSNKPTTFEDDTDYYLAMAYLKNDQPADAAALLEKIHQNPEHLYHDKVSSWLVWKTKHAH